MDNVDQPLVELYDFIASYKAHHGYSPSLEDMADAMNIPRSSVFHQLEAMESLGMIVQPRGFLRAIKLLSRQPRLSKVVAASQGSDEPAA